jgi:cold-inducible RNA-binding protein
MAKKLFVGNISWSMSEDDLRELFAQYGAVEEAIIIMDRATNRSKGFGFVTFPDDSEAEAAITALNGTDIGGREIVVNEARPREPRNEF